MHVVYRICVCRGACVCMCFIVHTNIIYVYTYICRLGCILHITYDAPILYGVAITQAMIKADVIR